MTDLINQSREMVNIALVHLVNMEMVNREMVNIVIAMVYLVKMAARSSDWHSSISLIIIGRLFGFALKHKC